jgi:hypothetical protein
VNYGVGRRIQLKIEVPWVRLRNDDGRVESGGGTPATCAATAIGSRCITEHTSVLASSGRANRTGRQVGCAGASSRVYLRFLSDRKDLATHHQVPEPPCWRVGRVGQHPHP